MEDCNFGPLGRTGEDTGMATFLGYVNAQPQQDWGRSPVLSCSALVPPLPSPCTLAFGLGLGPALVALQPYPIFFSFLERVFLFLFLSFFGKGGWVVVGEQVPAQLCT